MVNWECRKCKEHAHKEHATFPLHLSQRRNYLWYDDGKYTLCSEKKNDGKIKKEFTDKFIIG